MLGLSTTKHNDLKQGLVQCSPVQGVHSKAAWARVCEAMYTSYKIGFSNLLLNAISY